jgi:hypothetical protein
MAKKKDNPILSCPACLSDRLDMISVRMKKCLSCGFIWNHDVSDRDNLLLIMEHQDKREVPELPPTVSKTTKAKKTVKLSKAPKTRVAHSSSSRRIRLAR